MNYSNVVLVSGIIARLPRNGKYRVSALDHTGMSHFSVTNVSFERAVEWLKEKGITVYSVR